MLGDLQLVPSEQLVSEDEFPLVSFRELEHADPRWKRTNERVGDAS